MYPLPVLGPGAGTTPHDHVIPLRDTPLSLASGLLESDHVTASLRTNLHDRHAVVSNGVSALVGERAHVERAER